MPGPQWAETQWRSYGNEPAPGAPRIDAGTLYRAVIEKFPGWRKPSEPDGAARSPADDDDWDQSSADTSETAGTEDDAEIIDCYDIRRTDYPPLVFVAPPYILEGQFVLLSAPPKMGKSFFVLQVAIGIATGTPAFEGQAPCKKGSVLYLALLGALSRARR